MMRDAASERQVQASEPEHSVWLAANAGSGKTKVLTDRVARLLLGGTEPQRILCLTYTKAAASEMQNRLFRRLGEWAMLPESDLREALVALGVEEGIGPDTLARARRLFARAIETPGGLKIQTIHAFCAGLLRRFPIEAGVSPNFRELDDRSAKLLQIEIAEEMAGGAEMDAFDAVAPLVTGEDLAKFLSALSRNRDCFEKALSRDDALALFSLPSGYAAATLRGETVLPGDQDALRDLVPLLLASGKSDSGAGAGLQAALGEPDPAKSQEALESVLLYKEKARTGPYSAKVGDFPTKALREGAAEHLMVRIEPLMRRVEAGRERRLALASAEHVLALSRFARAFLPRYAARKAAAGVLDFDDLILRSAKLLSDRDVAGWVLFRLDGGIDHILVDEAQDTSPGQWTVIERLTDEFTSGQSARSERRTLFFVGDKKQSIYSFQGADLDAFDRMRAHFAAKFGQIGAPLVPLELEHSFRSADAILRVVDLTFDERVNRGLGGAAKHVAFKQDLPGRVDLWPAVPRASDPEPENWYDPVDLLPDQHHTVILARQIADAIRQMIDAGTVVPHRKGPKLLDEGDVLILVQRRSEIFHEIIRACKQAGLQVAGADRLKIGGELAVKDLTALLQVLATPEDDLALAALLRSPLFGWSEAALYRLAQPRPKDQFLWAALREAAGRYPDTMAIFGDLRRQADFLRPFEILERMLTRHGGRARLIARLGPEAEDGIDALLSEALSYEVAEVPSLTGFLTWLATDDVEIKRQLDAGSKAIRVMTVHGAKGLEAPLVILPDTTKRKADLKDEVLPHNGTALWKTKAAASPRLVSAAKDALSARQEEERMRLLYVAMTRAESWLIVCAAGEVGSGAESWYGLVAEGIEMAGAVDLVTPGGAGRRHENGVWPVVATEAAQETRTAAPPLPSWALSRPAPAPEAERPLSPSALGGAKALPGEAGLDEDVAKRRGTAIHRLVEHLPAWPRADWPEVAGMLLSDTPGLSADRDDVLAEAATVIDALAAAGYLGPETLVEVEVTARLPELGGRLVQGTIDRLILSGGGVLALDYKSNAVVPQDSGKVPDGILRQMGAYAAMLAQTYPGRQIETAILWTRTGQIMPLDAEIVRQALASTTIP
ncbi:MAG: double-strand break repair helicase AddA [Rhodobacteraceae bacterium]|nr:double-strand break repair helicase AddA [Paracoccaceae bacterium]